MIVSDRYTVTIILTKDFSLVDASSRAIPDTSTPVNTAPLPEFGGRTSENKATIPIPPIQAVDIRQKRSPGGSPSMSFKIEAPVVVKPDTLSKRAFMKVNSPPYIRYGIMPKKQAKSHEPTTI